MYSRSLSSLVGTRAAVDAGTESDGVVAPGVAAPVASPPPPSVAPACPATVVVVVLNANVSLLSSRAPRTSAMASPGRVNWKTPAIECNGLVMASAMSRVAELNG